VLEHIEEGEARLTTTTVLLISFGIASGFTKFISRLTKNNPRDM
jgi:hypothetical protein